MFSCSLLWAFLLPRARRRRNHKAVRPGQRPPINLLLQLEGWISPLARGVWIHSRSMDNRFWFHLRAGSCSRRNPFFVLCSTYFFLVLCHQARRRIRTPTPSI